MTTGTVTLSLPIGGDATGSIEIYNLAPNKARTLIRVDLSALGVGQITQDQRLDGTAGYAIDSLQGNREITGDQLASVKNNFPTPFLNYKENGTVELQGKEKVGDRDAYVLVGKPKEGPSVRLYLDAESYLPIKSVAKINVPQLGQESEQITELSDFRAVDGVQYAHGIKLKVSVAGQDFEFGIKVKEIKHNLPIEDSKFAKPVS